jgi:hypothetical protein
MKIPGAENGIDTCRIEGWMQEQIEVEIWHDSDAYDD